MAHSSAPASLVSESQVPLGRFRSEAIVVNHWLVTGRLNLWKEWILAIEKQTMANIHLRPMVVSRGELPSRLTG